MVYRGLYAKAWRRHMQPFDRGSVGRKVSRLVRHYPYPVELAGPGAFARTLPNEILVRIMQDPEQRKGFLEFCHQYDSHPSVCGLGKDNLFARGDIGGQEPAEQHSGEKEFSRKVQDEGDGV